MRSGVPPVIAGLTARFGPLMRRTAWGVADQGFSSLTNFALGILMARTMSLAEFGAFSLAFATYLFVMSVTRTFPMEPLAIRYTTAPMADRNRATARSTGSVLLVGVSSGLVCLGLGTITGGVLRSAFVALGLCFPGLLVQDAWRSAFFASGRGDLAFANDLSWAVIEFPALALLLMIGQVAIFWLVMAWGVGATCAALIGIRQAGVLPDPRRAIDWWREHADLGPRFIIEAAIRVGSGQGGLYLVGAVAGLAAVGGLRAGQLLLGPAQVIFMGVGLIAVPEGVRALGAAPRRLLHAALVMSVTLTASISVWGVLMWLVPDVLGHLALRSSWPTAHGLVPPVTIDMAATGAMAGAMMGLRALASAGRSLRANMLMAIVTLPIEVGGAALGGVEGAAWGLAAAGLLSVPIWWWELHGALAQHARSAGVSSSLA